MKKLHDQGNQLKVSNNALPFCLTNPGYLLEYFLIYRKKLFRNSVVKRGKIQKAEFSNDLLIPHVEQALLNVLHTTQLSVSILPGMAFLP